MAWTTPRTWADAPSHDHTASNYQTHITNNLKWVVRPVFVTSSTIDIVDLPARTPYDLFGPVVPPPTGYTATAVVPANYMGSSGCLRGTLVGDYLNNTGGDKNITVSFAFGDTTIWASGSDSITSHASRHTWRIQFFIANLNSALQQFCVGTFKFSEAETMTGIGEAGAGPFSDPIASATGPFVVPFGSNDIFSIDTTEDVPVTFTITQYQDPDVSFRRFWGELELVGQAA